MECKGYILNIGKAAKLSNLTVKTVRYYADIGLVKPLKNSGAFTVTQNEETSEVYGMPKAALEIGAAKCVLSLEQITEILNAQEVQFSC